MLYLLYLFKRLKKKNYNVCKTVFLCNGNYCSSKKDYLFNFMLNKVYFYCFEATTKETM